MGTGDSVYRPKRRLNLGSVITDRERFPNFRTSVFEIGHEPVRRSLLDQRRATWANETGDLDGDVKVREADREPASHGPGGVSALADQ